MVLRTSRSFLALMAIAAASCDRDHDAAAIMPEGLPVRPRVTRTIVSSEPSCGQCRLTLDKVVRLGSRNAPEGLGGIGRIVTRDSRGIYYVVDVMTAAREVFAFATDGQYLRSIGGRRGAGPGEYRFISQVFVLPGDSLRLHDPGNARYSIIDPNHRFVRTERYARIGYLSSLLLPGGRVITNDSRPPGTSAREGRGRRHPPIHIVDSTGAHLRSFGLEPNDSVSGATLMRRSLALARDGRLYVAHAQAYVVEVWDTLGIKEREVIRDATWFRPWTTQPSLSSRLPRQPELNSIHVDDAGRLWLLSTVMQRGWEKHLQQAPARDGEPAGGVELGGVTRNEVYDTVVEVIDPATGRLLVSERFDQWIYRILDGELAVSDGEDADLTSYVDIWQLRLVQP